MPFNESRRLRLSQSLRFNIFNHDEASCIRRIEMRVAIKIVIASLNGDNKP